MSKQLSHKLAFILFLVCASVCVETQAKESQAKNLRSRFQVAVNFECPLSHLPNNRRLLRELEKLVSKAQNWPPGLPGSGFKFDLNGDLKPEYLVFLGSGFLFSQWAIYTIAPVRFLGVITAQTIYLNSATGRWPRIHVLVRSSAAYLSFMDYCFRRGKYGECSKLRFIRDEKDIPKYFYQKPINCPKRNF